MAGTAAAASAVLTVMRTSSEPASVSAMACATVAATSAVSVLVIDCTTIGAPPPTLTPAMSTWRVMWRAADVDSVMAADLRYCSLSRATFCRVCGARSTR